MNVLLAESKRFSPQALLLLEELGTVCKADLPAKALPAAVSECEVLWVRLRHRIDEALMSTAPRLRWIVSPTTGLNHIDLEAASRRGIRVLSLRGEVDFLREIRATAELTLALMLALLRNLIPATRSVRGHEWDRNGFLGHELYERQIGLVGFGRLGRMVAHCLCAFGSIVRVHDPAVREVDLPGVSWLPLEELLPSCSVVSLHASHTPENSGFFDRSCFGRMRTGALFINTARGELVDEDALLQNLVSEHLGGAALDVLARETDAELTTHPLVQYARTSDRLLITPHIGGCTQESMERTEIYLATKLKEMLLCADLSSA